MRRRDSVPFKVQCCGDFDLIFLSNYATVCLPIYKILKHQERKINQFLKEEQIVVRSSPFGEENVLT